jgi:hypothetical protein
VRKRGLDQVIIITPAVHEATYNVVSLCCEKCEVRSS